MTFKNYLYGPKIDAFNSINASILVKKPFYFGGCILFFIIEIFII